MGGPSRFVYTAMSDRVSPAARSVRCHRGAWRPRPPSGSRAPHPFPATRLPSSWPEASRGFRHPARRVGTHGTRTAKPLPHTRPRSRNLRAPCRRRPWPGPRHGPRARQHGRGTSTRLRRLAARASAVLKVPVGQQDRLTCRLQGPPRGWVGMPRGRGNDGARSDELSLRLQTHLLLDRPAIDWPCRT